MEAHKPKYNGGIMKQGLLSNSFILLILSIIQAIQMYLRGLEHKKAGKLKWQSINYLNEI